MVKKLLQASIVAGAFYLSLFGAPQASAANDGVPSTTTEDTAATKAASKYTKATGGDRLVAIISPYYEASGYVMRAKGVKDVTHPTDNGKGYWCIRPSSSWDISKVVPAVSVEISASSATVPLAYYNAGGANCPAKYIEVDTYDLVGGNRVLSNEVAFTIVIP